MSDKAIIASLESVRPHPNADRLQLATVTGYQVVVGLDNKEGDRGIYFSADTQLSEEYATANDLVARYDETGKKVGGGFFDHKRRVRAQAFRGVRSDGLWMPLASLAFTGASTDHLVDGTPIDEYDGVPICRRYETPATRRQSQQQRAVNTRRETAQFRVHQETEQLRFYADHIPVGSRIEISEKIHGTSQRQGITWEQYQDSEFIDLPWWKRLINKVRFTFSDVRLVERNGWRRMLGTRRVIIAEGESGYYGNEQFRFNAAIPWEAIREGEVWYYEVVGRTTEGRWIMEPHDLAKLKDKALSAKYNSPMYYRYGTSDEMPTRTFVYRIVQFDESGVARELTEDEVAYRVRDIQRDGRRADIDIPRPLGNLDYDGRVDNLETLCAELREGESKEDSSHIREGVVLRITTPDNRVYFLKDKSYTFKVLEGILKEDENLVDLEEIA